jgi:hypothetical protein
MTITPQVLLDTSIAQLQTLASFLSEEMGTQQPQFTSQALTPQTRACKEILLTISVLIPKLQAARYVVAGDEVRRRPCLHCDDN